MLQLPGDEALRFVEVFGAAACLEQCWFFSSAPLVDPFEGFGLVILIWFRSFCEFGTGLWIVCPHLVSA